MPSFRPIYTPEISPPTDAVTTYIDERDIDERAEQHHAHCGGKAQSRTQAPRNRLPAQCLRQRRRGDVQDIHTHDHRPRNRIISAGTAFKSVWPNSQEATAAMPAICAAILARCTSVTCTLVSMRPTAAASPQPVRRRTSAPALGLLFVATVSKCIASLERHAASLSERAAADARSKPQRADQTRTEPAALVACVARNRRKNLRPVVVPGWLATKGSMSSIPVAVGAGRGRAGPLLECPRRPATRRACRHGAKSNRSRARRCGRAPQRKRSAGAAQASSGTTHGAMA